MLCRRRINAPICTTCLKSLPWNHNPCQRCAFPLISSETLLCGKCLCEASPSMPVLAAMLYQPPLRELIHAYKFSQQAVWAKLFAHVMMMYLSNLSYRLSPDALLAVPLHKKRLLDRGFNQADILAQHLSHGLNIPVIYLCTRVKNTLAQHGLTKPARKNNLRTAFSAHPKIGRYPKIAIVDDIMTTGATLSAMARAITLQNPQAQLQAWCLARAC